MEKEHEKVLANLEELQREAAGFARSLAPCAGHATLVTLSGELGAGKTSFAQGMARELGITDPITSPTFVLQKVYELSGMPFARLVHMDAYRLEDDAPLAPLRFSELYSDPQNLILLEWPEMVDGQLPVPDCRIQLAVSGTGRHISYS